MASMKAVVLESFGSSQGFVLKDVTVPETKEGHVRVHIKASAFNPVDYKIRKGLFGGVAPVVIGADFAGVVEDVGKGVENFKVGDEVYGMAIGPMSVGGAYAEKIVISQDAIAKKASSINFAEAASLPIVGLTAVEVYQRAQIKSNETVLIIGASGGVGSIITPMVVKTGAKVIATAGSDKSADVISKAYGVPKEHIVNYAGLSTDQISAKVQELNGGRGVDVAIDLFGGEIKKACVESLDLHGRFLTIVEEPEANGVALYPSQAPKNLFGISGTYHLVFVAACAFANPKYWSEVGRGLAELSTQIQNGLKVPPLEVVGSLSAETVQKAHDLLEGHHAHKKLVMTV